jgi:TonB family protein
MRQLSSVLRLLVGGLLLGLPGHYATAQAFGLTEVQPPYVEQLPALPGWGGPEATKLAIEAGIRWPLGVPRPEGRVVVRFTIEPTGAVDSLRIEQGLGAEANAAVLAAVRRLPAFSPGRQGGKPVRVAYTLGVALPEPPASPAPARDAQTRQQGVAQRQPGEADSTFVRRVLPVAYAQSHDLLAYAWRPSAFGKQLFFSVYGEEGNEYGTNLFVLDPYQENTYAVQVIAIAQADATYLQAIFFADANHDGRKDLLALSSYSLREPVKIAGEWTHGRTTHYHTDSWQYLAPGTKGRPQYESLPERPDLDELETAADVRAALAEPVPPRKPTSAKRPPKRSQPAVPKPTARPAAG